MTTFFTNFLAVSLTGGLIMGVYFLAMYGFQMNPFSRQARINRLEVRLAGVRAKIAFYAVYEATEYWVVTKLEGFHQEAAELDARLKILKLVKQ